MSEYDMSIHTNPDARVWAKFFMETWEKIGRPLPDEEMMIGWFANAMMAMHDHLKPNEAADLITALRAENEKFKMSLSDVVQQTQEQANTITTLRAENEKLRAALRDAAEQMEWLAKKDPHCMGWVGPPWPSTTPAIKVAAEKARAALEEKP